MIFVHTETQIPAFTSSFGLKSVVGLTVEIKLRFQISPSPDGRSLIPVHVFYTKDFSHQCQGKVSSASNKMTTRLVLDKSPGLFLT